MKNKPNILVCGTSQFHIAEQINDANPFDCFPYDADDEPEEEPRAGSLVRRIVETPVANFIETNALIPVFEKGDGRPCCGEMSDYVKEIEAELGSSGLLSGSDAKIDVIWYCLGDKIDFADEDELDFIRSASDVPRAIIIADPGFSSRSMFKETMDYLAGLAGHRLILNCIVVQPDALVLSGARRLLECTKNMCLARPALSKDERAAYESAWSEYYADVLDELQEGHEDDLCHVLQCGAERAQAILKRNETANLGNAIGECVSIAANLLKVVKGEANSEVMRNKSHADADKWDHQRTNELKFNIVCEVYEVAASFGRIVPRHVVRELLRLIPGDFPKDAAAVTYAIGRVAEVLSGDYFWYADAESMKAVFDEAKAEAMQMDFEPFDDSMIMRGEDEDIEPDFDDGEAAGEADADSDSGSEPGNETSDAFFEQVTKSIKASWAEQDAAGSSGGTQAPDAVANMPENSVSSQIIGNAGPALVGSTVAAGPGSKPGKAGITAKSKAGSSIKKDGVKPTRGKRTK